MSEAVIRLENVSKKFTLRHQKSRSFQDAVVNFFHRRNGAIEQFWALKDINITVPEGEAIGIVGRNGSGKSTILKLVTRILEPTLGKVSVAGKVSALIELGAGFHPDLTGRENIYLNGSILGLSRKEMDRKLDEIVAFSGLERFIDTPVKHYSSGMYMRLGFSVAVSVDPQILIIDEVLSVGDESFQRKCMEKIHDFKHKGVSIVFVSHSLDAVRSLCDRAVWLEAGEVREDAVAAHVVEKYLVEANTVDQSEKDEPDAEESSTKFRERNRWGTREIEITRVRLLDGLGKEKRKFVSGECLVVRMEYEAKGEISHPVFGIAIHTDNGVHITGPNTETSGRGIAKVDGTGYVDYIVENLPLVSGNYDLTVAAYDHTRTHAFDHQHRGYHFEVYRGAFEEDLGLVRIPCRWEHFPNQACAVGLGVAKNGR